MGLGRMRRSDCLALRRSGVDDDRGPACTAVLVSTLVEAERWVAVGEQQCEAGDDHEEADQTRAPQHVLVVASAEGVPGTPEEQSDDV